MLAWSPSAKPPLLQVPLLPTPKQPSSLSFRDPVRFVQEPWAVGPAVGEGSATAAVVAAKLAATEEQKEKESFKFRKVGGAFRH